MVHDELQHSIDPGEDRKPPSDDQPSQDRGHEATPRRRGAVRSTAARGQGRGVGAANAEPRRAGSSRAETPNDDLRAAAADSRHLERLERRLKAAGEDFRRGRFEEARLKLRPLAEALPQTAVVRELYGLTLYRLGRWKLAARELEAFRSLTGSVDQDPVLADCYRALRRYDRVDELWRELRSAGPPAALMAEGRIVVAGALADQGRLGDAISLLSRGSRPVRRAKEHHLRVAYALADLYERAGDLPRARELFRRVADHDPGFVDVSARLKALA